MTTTRRTDIHSEVNLVTEDYEFVLAVDTAEPSFGEPDNEHARWLRSEAARLTADSERGTHQCHHCGAWIRYAAIMRHVPTDTHIAVGETCLDNRFDRATTEFRALRKQAKLDAAQQRIRGLVAETLAEYPDLHWLGVRNWEKRAAAMPEHSRENSFLHDIATKLNRYGTLSERQLEVARQSVERDVEFAAKRAAWEAEAKANPPGPVPVGEKVDIEGEVVSRKLHESEWGTSWKLIVKLDNGSRVWFTEPSAVTTEVGDHVALRLSRIEPSDDESFGFGKRPTRFFVRADLT